MAGITEFIRELIRPMCDINHDGKLEESVEKDGTTYDEVSIFNRACESYNEQEQTIEVFENGGWIRRSISNLVETIKATNIEFVEKLEELYGKYTAPNNGTIPQISAEQAEKIEKEIQNKLIEKTDATYVATKAETEKAVKTRDTNSIVYEEIPNITITTKIEFPSQKIDNELLNKAFDNAIKDLMKKGGKKKSAILGMADAYFNNARDRNLNPFVLMGVSMIESSYGTSDWALKKNNVCGVHAHCKEVSDSIRIGSDVLQNNVYSKKLNTLKDIGMKGNYCCSDNATRARWSKNTAFFANKVINEYNRLLRERNVHKLSNSR